VLDIINRPVFYLEKRGKAVRRVGIVRDTTMLGVGVKETIFAALKVPRQRRLVLVVGMKLIFRINSILILILMKLEGLH
jgi:hypothetical protein